LRESQRAATLAQLHEAVCERRECFGDDRVVATESVFPDGEGAFEQTLRVIVETLLGQGLAELRESTSDDGML
jgi:hypothetical protein